MPCIADADDNEKLKNFVADACVNGEANPWLGIRNPFPRPRGNQPAVGRLDATRVLASTLGLHRFPDTDNEANTVASNWDWRDSGLPMCDADTTNYHAFEDPEPNNSDDIESCAEMKHGDGARPARRLGVGARLRRLGPRGATNAAQAAGATTQRR